MILINYSSTSYGHTNCQMVPGIGSSLAQIKFKTKVPMFQVGHSVFSYARKLLDHKMGFDIEGRPFGEGCLPLK